MKTLTTTALALVLAAGTAVAESHVMANDVATDAATKDTMTATETAPQITPETATETATTKLVPVEGASPTNAPEMEAADNERLIRTRDITGGDIYTLAEGEAGAVWDKTTSYSGINDGWNDVGSIEDVVLDRNGQMIGVVAEVGGFLNIGDKHVMLPIENVRLVPVDDAKYAVVTMLSVDELKSMKEVDEGFWD